MWKIWQVSSRSKVRNRVRQQAPVPLVVDSAMSLELLRAAETTVFRRGTGIALYLGADRFDLQFATKEPAQDMQAPSKLSMLRLRRFVWYLLGAADVAPFSACQDEPSTVCGNAVTCKSTSAGAVQLGCHTIETWSVNQSSARSDGVALEDSQSNTSCKRSFMSRQLTLMSR